MFADYSADKESDLDDDSDKEYDSKDDSDDEEYTSKDKSDDSVDSKEDKSKDSGAEKETKTAMKETKQDCNGCQLENCVPFGTRIDDSGISKYCDISGDFEV